MITPFAGLLTWFRPRVGQSSRLPLLLVAFAALVYVHATFRNAPINGDYWVDVSYVNARNVPLHFSVWSYDFTNSTTSKQGTLITTIQLEPSEQRVVSQNIGWNIVKWDQWHVLLGLGTTARGPDCNVGSYRSLAKQGWLVTIDSNLRC